MTKIKFQLRKVVATVICLTGTATIFAQEETGVVINGVMWATRNVDSVGTFVKKSENIGMFYRWNRIKAWTSISEYADQETTVPISTTWETVNDPSPDGWRVPSKTEIYKLLDTTKVKYEWLTENSVCGGRFTDKATGKSIFLPAAPWQDFNGTILSFDNTPENEDVYGHYWSSNHANSTNAYHLYFRKNNLRVYNSYYLFFFSIRPVKNFFSETDKISSDTETASITINLNFRAGE